MIFRYVKASSTSLDLNNVYTVAHWHKFRPENAKVATQRPKKSAFEFSTNLPKKADKRPNF
jgi:hypothetical protein